MKKVAIILILIVFPILLIINLKNTFPNSRDIGSWKDVVEANTIGSNDWLRFNSFKDKTIANYDNIVDISRTLHHSLYLTSDGKVYSSGYNYNGQMGIGKSLGNGSYASSSDSYETYIFPLLDNDGFKNDGITDPVIAIAAGGYHSIILTRSGVAYSFGSNGYGQIGTNSTEETKPVRIPDTTDFINGNVKAISAGHHHSIILNNDGIVYSSGRNNYGQLGLGNTSDTQRGFLKISDGTIFENGSITDPVVAISAGYDSNMLLTSNGLVYSFGRNNYGQLGDDTVENKSLPVKMIGAQSISAISMILDHGLVLTNSGTAYSVGQNQFGQLGNGKSPIDYISEGLDRNNDGVIDVNDAFETKLVKVQGSVDFVNNENIKAISAGRNSSMFLTKENIGYSVGYNLHGQLGNNKSSSDYVTDKNNDGRVTSGDAFEHIVVKITESDDGSFQNNGEINKIYAGGYSQVVFANNSVYSFGTNSFGQLGIGESKENRYSQPTRGGYFYSLSGKALNHTKIDKTKYNTDVLIDYVTKESKVSLKKGDGIFQEITLNSEGKYLMGVEGDFIVNVNEEIEITIKVEKDTNVLEYTFILDKKPPIIKDLNTACILEESIYYCKQNISLELLNDLSKFHAIKKIQTKVI